MSLYLFIFIFSRHRDKSGRRHEREGGEIGENGSGSLVDQAMTVIRRTAANASAYKLDFKKVFEEMDLSGDGFLSSEEMVRKLLKYWSYHHMILLMILLIVVCLLCVKEWKEN